MHIYASLKPINYYAMYMTIFDVFIIHLTVYILSYAILIYNYSSVFNVCTLEGSSSFY